MSLPKTIYLRTKDYLVSGEYFDLIQDAQKDLLQTMPQPGEDKLGDYYKSESYISHTDQKKSLVDKAYHFVKGIALKQKTSLITTQNDGKGKLLDIGCGTGDFLVAAKNKGWEVFGVEPNENARELSEKKEVCVKNNLEDIRDSNFDVITLWHVLEHVQDLDSYIKQISKLLNPKGTLIVAVPNYKSWDAKHYKEYWAAFDVPRHLWHFSKAAVERIFSPYHFKLIETKPMLFDSFYVSLLSEKYKTGKTNWVMAILKGSCSNLSGFFNKEYSSHVYILKRK